MDTKLKRSTAIIAATACMLSMSACGSEPVAPKATLLAAPRTAEALSYEQNTEDGFSAFKAEAAEFCSMLTAAAYTGENYAVSPVSVYMALALAAKCADGQTREEILQALGTDADKLDKYIPLLYRSLNNEYKAYGLIGDGADKTTGMLKLGNSIWINDGTDTNDRCINELAEKYFCYSYSADFAHDNKSANKAVSDFVSQQTNGLIDKDFELNVDTLFALINTLYLKDVWNGDGDPLAMSEKHTFNGKTASRSVDLVCGYYYYGKTYTEREFSAFYTSTVNGNMLKFIVPNDGYTIDDVFSADNIRRINAIDFGAGAFDHENKAIYHTRCLFPEYRAKFDHDIAPTLKDTFGINRFFDANTCDLSALTSSRAHCSKIRHVTDLSVDRRGIKGAAVTVEHLSGDGGPPTSEYKHIYETFTIDRSFGFIMTDLYDTMLFSGVINDL